MIQQQEDKAKSFEKMLNFVLGTIAQEERDKIMTRLRFDLITTDLNIN